MKGFGYFPADGQTGRRRETREDPNFKEEM